MGMIEDELRALMARLDPVPPGVGEAAKAAFTWRTVDDELAELMRDSAEDALAVRSGGGPRTLSYESPSLAVELEVTALGDRTRRVAGQLLPPAPAAVAVERGDGTRVATETDELGRFTFEVLPAGPARLRVTVEASTVALPWTSI